MDYKTLSARLSVSPQIDTTDLQDIKDRGFSAIICSRPDHEGEDQPRFQDIAAGAKKLGLEAVYLPVVPGQITDTDVADFGAALDTLPGPVLAYCRTGARAAHLWSLVQARVA